MRTYNVIVQRKVEQGGEVDVDWMWDEPCSVYMAFFDENPVGYSTCAQVLPDDVGRDLAVACLLQACGWRPDDA